MTFTFYLGVHRPNWLPVAGVPLFVSHRRLRELKNLPRARTSWALDSGGFSAITLDGGYVGTPSGYALLVQRYASEIGLLEFAAVQDWMCEPHMLKLTGLTIEEHQRRTIQSLEDLSSIAPDIPWLPVLQGWDPEDYLRHADAYEARGHALAGCRVGIGSVCRRQSTISVHRVLRELCGRGLMLHAFGFKVTGLRAAAADLCSSDSMAWSLNARKNPPMPGHSHKNCANCLDFALAWRTRMLASAGLSMSSNDDGFEPEGED